MIYRNFTNNSNINGDSHNDYDSDNNGDGAKKIYTKDKLNMLINHNIITT